MAASAIDTVSFIYKRDYSEHSIADITLRDHVWYAMLHKEGGFGGNDFAYPVRYGNPQGISGTFSKARANAKGSKGLQFVALRTHKFGVVTIDQEAILASKGNKKAFYNIVTMETDNVLEEMGDSLAFDFYRDKSGKRGRISAINGNVLTLTEPEDARNFKEGMTLQADNAEDGLTPSVGSWSVEKVDEDAGKVEVDDATGLSVNDYLFRDGDPGTCMEGLKVCTPLVAPTAGDSFRGKNRSVNPTRLAGVRIDDTSLPPEVVVARLAVKASKTGKSHSVDEGFMSPERFLEASLRLNAKVEYTEGGGTANYGFQYIMVHTAAGIVRVYSDPDCPPDEVRVSRNGSQYIKHLEGIPHIVDSDGLPALRMTDENAIEARVESYHNLIQDDPAAQGVGSVATSQ